MPIWMVIVSLQRVHGFILAINVIADLGRHHCIEHGLCGPSYGVTAKIYQRSVSRVFDALKYRGFAATGRSMNPLGNTPDCLFTRFLRKFVPSSTTLWVGVCLEVNFMLVSVRILIGAGFLLLPGLALAADLEKGQAAYFMGDYETSLAECAPLAEEGNADAQFCVGRLYANGFGVAMNDDLALQWYGRAAEQGHSEAQLNLGLMHANGWGVPMNDEEAVNWYRMAAEQGYVEAQTNLAKSYQKGRGVEQSLVEAYVWNHIALQLGNLNAKYDRDEVASKLSPEQLATAQQNADVWLGEHPDLVVADN
jgi:hypothetical protein